MQVAPAVEAGEGDREHGLVPHKFRVTWMRVGDEQGGPQEELTSVRAPVVCSSAVVASILMCGNPLCCSVLLLFVNADRGPGQLQVHLPGSLQPLCACVCSVQRVPGLVALLCVDCGCRGSLHMDEVSTQHLAGGGQPEAAADAKFTATLCCRVAREVKRQAERQVAGEEGRHGEEQDEEMRERQEREEGPSADRPFFAIRGNWHRAWANRGGLTPCDRSRECETVGTSQKSSGHAFSPCTSRWKQQLKQTAGQRWRTWRNAFRSAE